MTAVAIIIVSFLFTGIMLIALYCDPDEIRPKRSEHQAIEGAWRIKEISNGAREAMLREEQRHRWGADE